MGLISDFFNRNFARLSNGYIGTSFQSRSKVSKKAIVGYKAVKIRHTRNGFVFDSPSYNATFGVVADAECQQGRYSYASSFHKGRIDANCSCGWYSFKAPTEAFNYGEQYSSHNNQMVIESVYSGKYIEYTEGYRAETQRIKSIVLHKCRNCYKLAVAVGVRVDGYVSAFCLDHAMRISPERLYTFEEFSKNIPTPDGYRFSAPKVYSLKGVTPATRKELNKYFGARVTLGLFKTVGSWGARIGRFFEYREELGFAIILIGTAALMCFVAFVLPALL